MLCHCRTARDNDVLGSCLVSGIEYRIRWLARGCWVTIFFLSELFLSLKPIITGEICTMNWAYRYNVLNYVWMWACNRGAFPACPREFCRLNFIAYEVKHFARGARFWGHLECWFRVEQTVEIGTHVWRWGRSWSMILGANWLLQVCWVHVRYIPE